jgi:hypothetical protein
MFPPIYLLKSITYILFHILNGVFLTGNFFLARINFLPEETSMDIICTK